MSLAISTIFVSTNTMYNPSLEYIVQNLDGWNFPPKRSQLRGVASVTPTPEGKIHKSVTPTWETGSPAFISPPWPA
jgi:hypothetical protein